MSSHESLRSAAAVWDIACPSRARLAGVTMAGFRERAADPVDLTVVPYPAVTLVLDLGEWPVVVDELDGHRQRGNLVAGLAPGRIRARGREVECLQVRLSPVVAHAVLGGGASAASSGRVLDLGDLWGREAARTAERVRDARSWEDRFAIVEAVLARRLAEGPQVEREVAVAWSHVVASRGQVRVEQLAADLGWSRKRLWSRFRAQIGLTPKRAARLVRFDHAAHRLAAGDPAVLVAARCGYADQSHLHRDVASFAGVTPADVAVAPWLAVDDVAWAAPAPARP